MVKPFDGLQTFVPGQGTGKLGAVQRVGNLVKVIAHAVDLGSQGAQIGAGLGPLHNPGAVIQDGFFKPYLRGHPGLCAGLVQPVVGFISNAE